MSPYNTDEKVKDKHARTKTVLKVVGIFALVAGLGCVIVAFVDFFTSIFGDEMGMPSLFWLFFIGFPLLAGGGIMTLTGFRREVTTYMANESAPVFNSATEQMRPGFQNIAEAVRNTGDICPKCEQINDEGSSFCKKCGAALQITCICGATNDSDAKFCNKCGEPLE